MPRPIRVEYPGAFYHIINRGRGKKNIFHSPKYFQTFLDTISEACDRFSCIVHAYCLMSNHYHLILETPNGDLSKIMGYINGIYTQRYNRIKNTDGTLFKGRFKSILIDKDDYLVYLNKYIHRNPIPIVKINNKKLEDYKWSSYQSYLRFSEAPNWLNISTTLKISGFEHNLKNYKEYINKKNNESIEKIYDKKNLPSIIGSIKFKKEINKKYNKTKKDQSLNCHINPDDIIRTISNVFDIDEDIIINKQEGRNMNNFPRKIAIYFCQLYAKRTLSEIRNIFNLKSVGSVSNAMSSAKQDIKLNKYGKEVKRVIDGLFVIQ